MSGDEGARVPVGEICKIAGRREGLRGTRPDFKEPRPGRPTVLGDVGVGVLEVGGGLGRRRWRW